MTAQSTTQSTTRRPVSPFAKHLADLLARAAPSVGDSPSSNWDQWAADVLAVGEVLHATGHLGDAKSHRDLGPFFFLKLCRRAKMKIKRYYAEFGRAAKSEKGAK